jgi:hypothetical protein
MRLNRLYKVLVAGGASLVLGACSGSTSSTLAVADKPTPKKAIDCTKVCTDDGAGMMCPRLGSDMTVCCWLMPAPRHECCAQKLRAPTPTPEPTPTPR